MADTCAYVARKDDPGTWHGDSPNEWFLDKERENGGLEIDDWSCPHPQLDLDGAVNHNLCIFHTNPEDIPQYINESELLLDTLRGLDEGGFESNIEHRGQFIGARFGDIDISGETINTDAECDIRFDHAVFEERNGDLNFQQTRFEAHSDHIISFVGAEFSNDGGDILFNDAEFEANNGGFILFNNTLTNVGGGGTIDFSNADFQARGQGVIECTFATIQANAGGDVSFSDSSFYASDDSAILFGGTKFNAKGGGDVVFEHSNFRSDNQGNVDFMGTRFDSESGSVEFDVTEFRSCNRGTVSFLGATFNTKGQGHVGFIDSRFETEGDGDIIFSNTAFCAGDHGDVLFPGTEFLTNSSGKIQFTNAQFEAGEDLWFTGSSYCSKGAGGILFSNTAFVTNSDSNLTFSSSTFHTRKNGVIDFGESHFKTNGEVEFSGVDQHSLLTFEGAEFSAPVEFTIAATGSNSRTIFSGVEFNRGLVFGAAEEICNIQGYYDFSDAQLDNSVELQAASSTEQVNSDSSPDSLDNNGTDSAQFTDSIDCSGAEFPEGVDFSDIQFPAETNFDGAILSGVNFTGADLSGASFERAQLNRAEFNNTNLVGAKLYGALLGDVRIDRKTKFWPTTKISIKDVFSPTCNLSQIRERVKTWQRRGTLPYCVYDPRYHRGEKGLLDQCNEGELELEKAAEVYGSIESLARANSLPELASQCFLGRKDIQYKQYRKEGIWSMVIRSYVPNLIARYGESPWRVLGTGAIVVLISAFLYWKLRLIKHVSTPSDSVTLFDAVYFSALTFTTLGYGDFNPVSPAGQILAVAETSFGVILLAILVFVFGRRATR